MDVLRNARHQVGTQFAVFRVFFPLVVVAAIVLCALMYVGYSEGNQWLATLLFFIEVMMFLLPVIAYFVARKNPRLIKNKLEEMVKVEEMVLKIYEESLNKYSQELKDLVENRRSHLEDLWQKNQKRIIEKSIADIERNIGRLIEMDQKASPAYKIKNQEQFILLHQLHRGYVDLLEFLKKLQTGPIPEETYEIIRQLTQESFDKLIKHVETNVDFFRGKVAESRSILSEAQKLRQE